MKESDLKRIGFALIPHWQKDAIEDFENCVAEIAGFEGIPYDKALAAVQAKMLEGYTLYGVRQLWLSGEWTP